MFLTRTRFPLWRQQQEQQQQQERTREFWSTVLLKIGIVHQINFFNLLILRKSRFPSKKVPNIDHEHLWRCTSTQYPHTPEKFCIKILSFYWSLNYSQKSFITLAFFISLSLELCKFWLANYYAAQQWRRRLACLLSMHSKGYFFVQNPFGHATFAWATSNLLLNQRTLAVGWNLPLRLVSSLTG